MTHRTLLHRFIDGLSTDDETRLESLMCMDGQSLSIAADARGERYLLKFMLTDPETTVEKEFGRLSLVHEDDVQLEISNEGAASAER